MSYVEHGPRIFLAGDNNKTKNSSYRNENGDDNRHLLYGDYVLPRKRSEGRLKTFESCTDLRAWCQNSLENSKYIRELSEHAKTPGKIVPLNVVIDNVIGLGAKTQNELTACKRDLKKYKSLILTPEQEHQLQLSSVPGSPRVVRSRSKPSQTGAYKSEYGTSTRSYSASPRRSPRRDKGIDKSFQTEKPILKSQGSSAIQLIDYDEKQSEEIFEETRSEIIDNFDDPEVLSLSKNHDFVSIESTSDEFTIDDYDDEDEEIENERSKQNSRSKWSTPEKNTLGETASTSETPGRNDTETETGTRTGTASVTDYDTDEETNKATIIQKDSEIIALKNELGVKEAEIEELKDVNKLLEKTLNEKNEGIQFLKGNLQKMSEQQLVGVSDDIIYESERLKKMLGICESTISELKGDLKERASSCRAQAHEIEDLRYRLKESESLRLERDSLARKVNEMGDLLVDADKCTRALSEMKFALRERDELRCQNREQSCLLADQEDEIKRLLLLVKRLSAKYGGRQVKMRGVMDNMRIEIEEKNSKICQCEEELSMMSKEVGCLNVKLKKSLNSMDDFKLAYQDACNCADLDRDIYSQAKNALCKLNQTMLELKEYKSERENLLRQIEEMKTQIQNNNNKLNKFSCQSPQEKDNKNDHRLTELSTLDLRKRKCMLQEDLEELDKELGNRMGADNKDGVAFDDQLDVVASAKQTINRLNNAMLDLDAWECEKASMQDTIERLKIQITTLTGNNDNGGGEDVESRIVDQASYSLAKLNQLLKELKQYQTERELMQKQIHNLTEALKDSQSAASCKGVTLLKQRLHDLRLENEKDRAAYAEEVKNLQSRLEEAENESSCAGVKALRRKLREAIRESCADTKIDEALAIHVKKSIEKVENISKEIKEVDDERAEIVKEIAKQQGEIEARNVEIVRLKKQMDLEFAKRKGEGDRAEEGIQQLAETKRQLDIKDGMIRDLEDRLESLNFQNLGSTEEQTSLRKQIEIMENEREKLIFENDRNSKELELKNEEVACLIRKINSSAKILADFKELEKQMEEMNPRLVTLQTQNKRLTIEVATLNGVLSERNEEIISLVDEREKHLENVSEKVSSYDNELSKRQKEFDRILRANKSLTTKLLEAEGKIIELNRLVSDFDAERAKLDQMSNLHREIQNLTKEKEKLEGYLRGFKTQLISLETSNKKLEDNLNRTFGENDTLKTQIEHLCNENARMSSELVGEVSAKEQLSKLPDKLNKDIAGLKERLKTTEERNCNILEKLGNRVEELGEKSDHDDHLIDELQRANKFYNEQAFIHKEKISVLEKSNNELKAELNQRLDELKDLNIGLKMIENNDSIEGNGKSKEFGMEHDVNDSSTVSEMTCKLNNSENENKQRKTEIHKLQCDLKSKNCEINSLREQVKALVQEKDALNEKITNKEIQSNQRLLAVKSIYEGRIKSLFEDHNASIANLQSQYEEARKDSDYFDPQSWLRSLSLKEIVDLHDRICMDTNSCSINIPNDQQSDYSDNNSLSATSLQRHQHEYVNEKHQLSMRIANLENEIVQREQEARKKVYELEAIVHEEKNRSQEFFEACKNEEKKNAELQNQIIFLSHTNQRNTTRANYEMNKLSFCSTFPAPVTNSNENENRKENEILHQRSTYNQDRVENYGMLLEPQRKMEFMDNVSPKKEANDLNKDFIYQCSTYKGYANK